MEEEIKSLIKVLITVLSSLTYCYYIPTKIPRGATRLLALLPIITLFTLLPLKISSVNLSGDIGFFIAWLANFKLLLLAFGQGPLSSSRTILSLPRFICFACLPIKTNIIPSPQITKSNPKIGLNSAIKVSLLAVIFQIYYYKDELHPTLLLLLYCFHAYFSLEVMLVIVMIGAQTFLGLELEPPFDQPHLSTSLQDFWGKRWNLMVTGILRPTVFYPVRNISSRRIGREWALILAVVATFVVSGFMHELIFFYMCRLPPTWLVIWFFILHGVCLVVEILVKKKLNDKWRLPPMVSTLLTVGFVVVTSFWLFFPPLLRGGVDDRGFEEVQLVLEYAKWLGQSGLDSIVKVFV